MPTAGYEAAGSTSSVFPGCSTEAQPPPGPTVSPPWDLGGGKPSRRLMLALVTESLVSDSGVIQTGSYEGDRKLSLQVPPTAESCNPLLLGPTREPVHIFRL